MLFFKSLYYSHGLMQNIKNTVLQWELQQERIMVMSTGKEKL